MKIIVGDEVLKGSKRPISDLQKEINVGHKPIAKDCGMKMFFTKDGTRSFALDGFGEAIEIKLKATPTK